jgi:hypothetical protein
MPPPKDPEKYKKHCEKLSEARKRNWNSSEYREKTIKGFC